ncbi:hypothetical protein TcasGA2_TC010561 [Tribolium castaneum]|uniref:Uncharacterized protein n=1 Tax=Tribolium castaneum TaxID=7070 RepID=D2CFX3_TRICA|nr:PREDICTED: uncharacterized protein LOC103312382 isoform X2 [Tribolium castaneum]XP_015840190.1 PREDICTED: uncharacterized protein LOC103312382 isoform X2 [Tribolium castaneum]EFA13031.1 hypothetical protein TcasGA2_TC010561 [Tribolium castaneum]|eukprot:XP_008191102.1 PREDICTED: uncharacterized protein LOC103312382 isoform X2 [Tribolium castaneum]
MDSDSSSYYATTYSEDERIEKALQAKRRKLAQLEHANSLGRQKTFGQFAESELDIFRLTGLKFHTFRHSKIKFSFHPASVTNFVNQNVRFYVSLKYAGRHWRLKRDSLPANFKWKIYSLFYSRNFFEIDDENILATLLKIYELLVLWTQKEEQYRVDKFQRFKEGEDVELDSDDEQFFLSQSERNERLYKKTKILRRMIPPRT